MKSITADITIKQHTSYSQKFAEVDLVKKDDPAARDGTIKNDRDLCYIFDIIVKLHYYR